MNSAFSVIELDDAKTVQFPLFVLDLLTVLSLLSKLTFHKCSNVILRSPIMPTLVLMNQIALCPLHSAIYHAYVLTLDFFVSWSL